ncbi:hypothetical protein K469DRAFT_710871 [Zopfia rhizophila CBS 207.26]|uniref:Uncharacterized protein n=1 Tax=Zopfia rhizophila CBS 207.26 TaxID=1314779 RepID=A0A6A6DWG0_9PEZI|nr:hypothetical protein K469DRAFT_710871 [Zopfia rhizophila CBS 207.26]
MYIPLSKALGHRCPMDTGPCGNPRERSRGQGRQGGHRMERRRPQMPTSRYTSKAASTEVNIEEMVQDTDGEGVDDQMESRDQGSSDLQTHTGAHQKGTPASRGAQQTGERAAGADANGEDWTE